MSTVDLSPCCILIVDDEQPVIDLLRDILEASGYHNLVSTTDPRTAAALYAGHTPDLILLDLHMPQLGGVAVISELRNLSRGDFLPIVVLTGDLTVEAKRQALRTGATDFLVKPFDPTEVLLRIENLLLSRVLHLELKRHRDTLEQRVSERTRQLAEAQLEILNHLAIVSEYQDDDTSQHTERVGEIAAILARALGQNEEHIKLIRLAAPLHDIGKVGVPNHILVKSGKLMPSEFEIMRSHTTVGGEIFAKSSFPLLQLARQIALYHHERWDGLGYPQKLRAEQIPLPARIVAVADAFDALTHGRPYKKPMSFQQARAEIRAQSGSQFDPAIVELFLSAITPQIFEEIRAGTEANHNASVEALAVACDSKLEFKAVEEAASASRT